MKIHPMFFWLFLIPVFGSAASFPTGLIDMAPYLSQIEDNLPGQFDENNVIGEYCSFNNVSWANCSVANANISAIPGFDSIPEWKVGDNFYTLYLKFVDGSGNVGLAKATFETMADEPGWIMACVKIGSMRVCESQEYDLLGPVFNCKNYSEVATNSSGSVVNYAVPVATDKIGVFGDVACSPASGIMFPVGSTAITCNAIDFFGWPGSCVFSVVVSEPEPTPSPTPEPTPSPTPEPTCEDLYWYNNAFRYCQLSQFCSNDVNPGVFTFSTLSECVYELQQDVIEYAPWYLYTYGKVVDADGNPQVNAIVYGTSQSWSVTPTLTQSDGSFNFPTLDYLPNVTVRAVDAFGRVGILTEPLYGVNKDVGNVIVAASPRIQLIGLSSVVVQIGEEYVDEGVFAFDNTSDTTDYAWDITENVITFNPVVDVVGSYSVTYDVSDSSGNSAAQVTRMVTVIGPESTPSPEPVEVTPTPSPEPVEVTPTPIVSPTAATVSSTSSHSSSSWHGYSVSSPVIGTISKSQNSTNVSVSPTPSPAPKPTASPVPTLVARPLVKSSPTPFPSLSPAEQNLSEYVILPSSDVVDENTSKTGFFSASVSNPVVWIIIAGIVAIISLFLVTSKPDSKKIAIFIFLAIAFSASVNATDFPFASMSTDNIYWYVGQLLPGSFNASGLSRVECSFTNTTDTVWMPCTSGRNELRTFDGFDETINNGSWGENLSYNVYLKLTNSNGEIGYVSGVLDVAWAYEGFPSVSLVFGNVTQPVYPFDLLNSSKVLETLKNFSNVANQSLFYEDFDASKTKAAWCTLNGSFNETLNWENCSIAILNFSRIPGFNELPDWSIVHNDFSMKVLLVDADDNYANLSFGVETGGELPNGTVSVSIRSYRPSGGASFLVSQEFSVDTHAPVIVSNENISVNATNSSGAVVTYSIPVAMDMSPIFGSVNCSPSSGSVFAFGSNAVTCSAMDYFGNTDTSTFFIDVAAYGEEVTPTPTPEPDNVTCSMVISSYKQTPVLVNSSSQSIDSSSFDVLNTLFFLLSAVLIFVVGVILIGIFYEIFIKFSSKKRFKNRQV